MSTKLRPRPGRILLMAGARHPERAKGAKAVEVFRDRQKAPRRLTGGQDLVQPVEGLVPQIISLQLQFKFNLCFP